jgi:hypothetical protein
MALAQGAPADLQILATRGYLILHREAVAAQQLCERPGVGCLVDPRERCAPMQRPSRWPTCTRGISAQNRIKTDFPLRHPHPAFRPDRAPLIPR